MNIKNLVIICLAAVCGLTQSFSQSGYTLTVSPSLTVADGIGGEETYLKWEVPPGTINWLDFVNIYEVRTNGLDLIWFKQAVFRYGDSQYAFQRPGEYEVAYLHFSFFLYYLEASARVTVSPTVSLVASASNYPPAGQKIIAFGDSLVQGVGATKSNLVNWLEAYTGLPIINAGQSGDTTADALKRLKADVLDKEPDVVLILLGGNDYLQNLPAANTFANLRQIVHSIQAAGALPVIIGVYVGALSDRFREGFHDLYMSTRAVFIPDILQGIAENPFLLGNSLHPNDEGYRRMAARIAPVINKIMEDVIRPALRLKKTGQSAVLTWLASTNLIYEVQFRENFKVNGWQTIAALRLTNSADTELRYNITLDHPGGFFRLEQRK